MASLVENVNSVLDIFNQAKAELREKGIDVSEHAVDIPTEIASIEGKNLCWKYFDVNLTDDRKIYRCGFRPIYVMCVQRVGEVRNFSTAIATLENGLTVTRGSRFGTQNATGESGLDVTILSDGFSAAAYSSSYNGQAQFIAVGEQDEPVGSVKYASGNFELTKGTALKEIDLGFKPQVLILNQRTTNDYKTASARTFIYNESLSSTQYDSIVTTTVTKQALGSNTVLQIYSIEDNGFTQRPHASNTTYWSYYAVGGIDATPMLLSDDDGGEK